MKIKFLLSPLKLIIRFTVCLLAFTAPFIYASHDATGKRHSDLQAFFSWNDFVDRWKNIDGQLIDVKIIKFKSDNKNRYLGAWRLGNGKGGALYRYSNWSDFVTQWKALDKQRLIDIDISKEGSTTWYTGTWQPNAKSGALYSFNPDYALGAKKIRKILVCIVNFQKAWPPYWW